MAPVVHGLETKYEGRIDFLYLNVALTRNDSAKRAFGFTATPHFFLLDERGTVRSAMRGVLPEERLRGALDRLLVATGAPPAGRP